MFIFQDSADHSQMPERDFLLEECSTSAPRQESAPSMSSMGTIKPPSKRLKPAGPLAKQNELLALACEYLAKPQNDTKDDENLAIARVWANKLKDLQPHQKLFAEKAINDVLFEALLGNLHKDSVKINENPKAMYNGLHSPSLSSRMCSTPTPMHKSAQVEDHSYIDMNNASPAQNESVITLFSTFTGE